tara:strand:- start:72 stop:257 length:186 start_codon:yes stop_codon:yes gene_type:complete
MKNPSSLKAGAFQMSVFTNTLTSTVDATSNPVNARNIERRFRWDKCPNSIEPLVYGRPDDV